MMKKSVVLFIGFIMAFTLQVSAEDNYHFKNEVTQKRYNTLVKELRCPKCQNQNLADSNSPIAKDLRQEVYDMLHQNKSDGEIVNFMVERYGDYVLYRPRVSSLTYILWFGPAFLLLIGAVIVVLVLRKKPIKKEELSLTSAQQSKLDQILKDK